jgi:hypothetical protein
MANNKNRSGGRFNRFNRGGAGITKNTVFDSSGPCGRLRGTAPQLIEKYLAGAKELRHNDPILSEVLLQHAEHYTRLYAMACANEVRPEPVVQPAPQVEEETPAVESEATEQKEEATQQEEQTEVVSKPKRRPKKVQEPVTETAEPEAAALKNLPFMEEPVVSEKKTRRKLTLEKISVQENTEE